MRVVYEEEKAASAETVRITPVCFTLANSEHVNPGKETLPSVDDLRVNTCIIARLR